jgi:hypothetical protein
MHPRCSQARYSVFLAVATPRPLMSELGLAESDAIATVSGAGISTIAHESGPGYRLNHRPAIPWVLVRGVGSARWRPKRPMSPPGVTLTILKPHHARSSLNTGQKRAHIRIYERIVTWYQASRHHCLPLSAILTRKAAASYEGLLSARI